MGYLVEDKESAKAFADLKASVKAFGTVMEMMETADRETLRKRFVQLRRAETEICNSVLRLEYVLDVKGVR